VKRIIIFVVLFAVLGGSLMTLLTGCSSEAAGDVRVEYTPGDVFTTNVKDSYRILKTSIVLVVNKEGMEETLAKENTRIRDSIIFLLRQLDEDAVRAPGTQERLRNDIITALNERLELDIFVEVLFNDFVMG